MHHFSIFIFCAAVVLAGGASGTAAALAAGVAGAAAAAAPAFGHALRADFFYPANFTQLNHGAYGGTPRPVVAAQYAAVARMEADLDNFMNGASGYRLQVTPAKKAIELFKGDTVAATAPFDWKSGEWTELRLSVRKVKDDEFAVEGKAWTAGTAEPAAPVVSITEAKVLPAGKSGTWGMPFAGTPIRFDDLKVTRLP